MTVFRTFATTQEARDYRHANGTGGWIFSPDNGGDSILFPPEFPPAAIFSHRLTRGLSGSLMGAEGLL